MRASVAGGVGALFGAVVGAGLATVAQVDTGPAVPSGTRGARVGPGLGYGNVGRDVRSPAPSPHTLA